MSNLADTGVGANSLSIITVVLNYNAGAYLAAYLKALITQSHENIARLSPTTDPLIIRSPMFRRPHPTPGSRLLNLG